MKALCLPPKPLHEAVWFRVRCKSKGVDNLHTRKCLHIFRKAHR